MDMSYLMSRHLHSDLAWLGKHEWLRVTAHEGGTYFDVDRDVVRRAPGYAEHAPAVEMVMSSPKLGGLTFAYIEALAKSLADGPKLLQPSEESWEAMEHVEVRVPVAEYSQPFPSMVVKIPTECRRRMAEQCGVPIKDCPQMLVARYRAGPPVYILIGMPFKEREFEQMYSFCDRKSLNTIEEALSIDRTKQGAEYAVEAFEFTRLAARATINLMLLAVHYGTEPPAPLDPAAYTKHRRRRELAHYSHGDFLAVNMKQNVVVRRVERSRSDGEPTGREMPPHWRAGHWRNQAYGAGIHKRILIAPVLVRSDRVVGDVSQSEYTSHV